MKPQFCFHCGEPLVKDQELPTCSEHGVLWALYRNAICADAIVIKNNNEILLVKRANEPHVGYWGIPGGFTDYGEHPQDTVKREVHEETGYLGEVGKISGVYIEHCPGDKSAEYRVSTTYVFFATSQTADHDDEVSEAAWFKLTNLPEMIPDSHRIRIDDYIATLDT